MPDTPPPDAPNDDAPIGHLQRRKNRKRRTDPVYRGVPGEIRQRRHARTRRRHHPPARCRGRRALGQDYGRGLAGLKDVAEKVWAGGGSLEVDVIAASDERLDFNVTRCRYAEFYKDLGLADLGYLVHCNRDHAMIDGFNPELKLTRTQTVMEGAPYCDFRFSKKRA